MTRPLVLITEEGTDAEPLAWLGDRAEVMHASLDSIEARPVLDRVEGLLVRTYTLVTADVLTRLPALKVVGRGGVGLDNIDVQACRARGVEVVYTPEANTIAVAEYVFGLVLASWRSIHDYGREVSDPAAFKRYRATLRGRELRGATLGILGMGRIGRTVGRIASVGFGMRVLYHDLVDVRAAVDFPAEHVSLPTLARESDVFTVHVDMRPGNEGLVAHPLLAQLKPGALLVNTCRGEVVDLDAVAAALNAGRLGGAAIDVFAPEPPSVSLPLIGLPHVMLSPHVAARTARALTSMSWVVRDVIEVIEGRPPRYPAPPAPASTRASTDTPT